MPKALSAGFVIWCPSGLLLGHVTGAQNWDVPKGGVDPGESPLQAAVRELGEETSLIYRPNLLVSATTEYEVGACQDLGQHAYTKGKDLHLFQVSAAQDIDVGELACTSMVIRPAYSFPEIDRFKIFTPREIQGAVRPALYDWLKAHVKLP